MGVRTRNHVTVTGREDGPVLSPAHGFGCDQNIWRPAVPIPRSDSQVFTPVHAGAGRSGPSAWSDAGHTSRDGHVDDDLATGHRGGFGAADMEALLGPPEANCPGRPVAMAPVTVGDGVRPEPGQEPTSGFCRTAPRMIARVFAHVTFLSGNRAGRVRATGPAPVAQSSRDLIAPPEVGAFVRARVPGSEPVALPPTGHCPRLSAPEPTAAAIGYSASFASGGRR
ncbi:alpha/beta fold hydrolase [Streptomyces sp. NPDC048392]|uniref:alpha/beta fold hydrolase n=1 Tax=Streptomyces sp. NPDC048392 TaxID=3365543 RepID=UPI003716FA23